MLNGNVTNQLKHGDRFANTRTAKQAHFTATSKWTDKVDHLDPRLQNVIAAHLVFVFGCLAVNGHVLSRIYRTLLIDRIAEYIHDPAEGFFPDRDRNRLSCVGDFQAA